MARSWTIKHKPGDDLMISPAWERHLDMWLTTPALDNRVQITLEGDGLDSIDTLFFKYPINDEFEEWPNFFETAFILPYGTKMQIKWNDDIKDTFVIESANTTDISATQGMGVQDFPAEPYLRRASHKCLRL